MKLKMFDALLPYFGGKRKLCPVIFSEIHSYFPNLNHQKNRITPNDYNQNVIEAEILAKFRAEIADKGLCEPVIVRSRGDGL
ncbi:MAG: hypothetical protein KJ661_05860 [Candidatus Omnitrophica bacterium]|nr:hypothetical protein [Candidatus Omnitrophota bacterium]